MSITNQCCLSQGHWSAQGLVGILGHELLTDRAELAVLLLKPFRVRCEMPEEVVFCGRVDRGDVQHNVGQGGTTAALVRSAHENDAIG